MAAKPLSNIHFVGIVAEWLVAYWKRTRTAVRVPERINQPTTLTGIVPECRLWRAAKPGPRRGAVQRPTLNNQAASKMLGLQNRSPHNDLGYAGHSAEQRPSYLLPDRHVRGTRTLFTGSFPDGNYACK